MNNNLKFRRNVYIILLSILIFGIMSQMARSDLVLKYVSNDNQLSLSEWRIFQQSLLPMSMLRAEADTADTQCFIYDSADSLSERYLNNFREVYRYLKQPYTVQDVQVAKPEYSACRAVVLLNKIETLDGTIEALERYLFEGGQVFMARMDHPGPVFTSFYRKLGIVNYWYVIGNNDITFTSNLLIGQEGRAFTDDFFYNDSLSVELDHNSELLAKGDKSPLIWRYDYGKGSVVVYNGNNLFSKSNRGLIVGAVSMLLDDYIYPIFNAKLFYIDDYPSPVSTDFDPVIRNEYNRNIASFFKAVWWPDMIRAAKKYDLHYTAVLIQDYNDAVSHPLPSYRQEELTNLIVYGREVLKIDGEIGIHGYNHQPLQFNEDIAREYSYNTWASYDDMEASIQEVVAYMSKAFPNYDAVSYVPPSNILGAEGRQALIDNWPSLRVISSLYEEDHRGYTYVQEFEVAEDGIVEMPRITSGYVDAADMLWLEASAMTTHGFISHFIHPDDLLDQHRSGGRNWRGLYQEFENMLTRMNESYPWLKARTSGDAASHIAAVLNSRVTRDYTEDRVDVKIDGFMGTQYFIMRTDKKIGQLKHCRVKNIDHETYLVEAMSEQFTIELK